LIDVCYCYKTVGIQDHISTVIRSVQYVTLPNNDYDYDYD